MRALPEDGELITLEIWRKGCSGELKKRWRKQRQSCNQKCSRPSFESFDLVFMDADK
ncbi:hypothetical protein BS17DRAFT_213011 [Gyrodon lividus]|nr:hypothetical protein BS17DRAFT_213011 [Gyrodon lividus]